MRSDNHCKKDDVDIANTFIHIKMWIHGFTSYNSWHHLTYNDC